MENLYILIFGPEYFQPSVHCLCKWSRAPWTQGTYLISSLKISILRVPKLKKLRPLFGQKADCREDQREPQPHENRPSLNTSLGPCAGSGSLPHTALARDVQKKLLDLEQPGSAVKWALSISRSGCERQMKEVQAAEVEPSHLIGPQSGPIEWSEDSLDQCPRGWSFKNLLLPFLLLKIGHGCHFGFQCKAFLELSRSSRLNLLS